MTATKTKAKSQDKSKPKSAAKPSVKSASKKGASTKQSKPAKAASAPAHAIPEGRRERSAALVFHNLQQMIADQFETATGGMPTTTQFELLNAIHSMDGPSQTAVGNATGMDRSTVAEVIKRLVARGYIERHRLPNDERTFVISLTERGKEALIRGEKAMKLVEDKLSGETGFSTALKWATDVIREHGRKPEVGRGQSQSPKIIRSGPVGGVGTNSGGNLGAARTRPLDDDAIDADRDAA
jgi:DNA-binding MarR family transcriptional regulator